MKLTIDAVAKLKKDFPLLANNSKLIYVDNAATTQKPKQVIAAMETFYKTQYAAVHRGLYPLAANATQLFEDARKKVAQFINVQPNEIIFTHGTTESLNGLARSIQSVLPKDRKKILLTEMEHHANIVPWQQFAKRHGYNIDYVTLDDDYKLSMQQLKGKLDKDVAMIAFTHVSNVLGTINPVKEICKLAKDNGTISVIDGAQAIAHLEVDVQSIGCDFYAFSGHKLYGPTGVGVLFGKMEHLSRLEPFSFGGHMIEFVTKHDANWAAIPQRFEAGTPPIAEVIGLSHAIAYLETIGLDDISKWESELTRYAITRLSEVSGLELFHTKEGKMSGILSFVIHGAHAHDIASLCGDDGVCIRAGHHCAMPLNQILDTPATARISFGLYNTMDDVDAIVISLKRISKLFGGKR